MAPKEVSVRVIGRFRPINKRETAEAEKRKWEEDYLRPCLISEDNKNVEVQASAKHTPRFSLDYFLPENTTQSTCFELVVLPIVKDNIQGINGTVFAYGQTGSGKTWSMFGPEGSVESLLKSVEHLGLIPRAATTMFDILEKSDRFAKYEVQLSVLEIYVRNELRDLLHPKKKGDKPLKIREGAKRIFVQGLKTTLVKSVADVLKYIAVANKHRTVSCTQMNATSSRSHSIFTLELKTVSKSGSKLSSRISFCDLAGSEKVGKTGAAGKQMQEGMAINQSLTCLGQVITALVEHRKPSFRDTALTHVLKDSLVGNCKTTILVCLSPHRFNVMETINTLRFAQRAKMIKNKFKVNKTRSAKELLRELKSKDEEIRLLKSQLQRAAMKAVSFALPAQGTPYIRFLYTGKNVKTIEKISKVDDEINAAVHKAKEKSKLGMLKTRLVIQDSDERKESCKEVLVLCDATSEYEKDALTKARDQLHSCLVQEEGILKTAEKVELLFQSTGDQKSGLSNEAQNLMVSEIKKLKAKVEEQKVTIGELEKKNEVLRIESNKLKINVEHTDELYADSLERIKNLEAQLHTRLDHVTELQTAIVRASTGRQDSMRMVRSLSMDLPQKPEVETVNSLKGLWRDTMRNASVPLSALSPQPVLLSPSQNEEKDGSSEVYPSDNEDYWRSSTNLPLPRPSILGMDRQSIRETLSLKLSPEDFTVELETEEELKRLFNMMRLELKNLHTFYMEAKDFEHIEQNKFFYDESFKVIVKTTGQFTQQVGVAFKEIDKLLSEITDYKERIATLERQNGHYENEMSAYRNVIDSIERSRNNMDEDDGFYGESLAAELGLDDGQQFSGYQQSTGSLEVVEEKTEASILLISNESDPDAIEELDGGDRLSVLKKFEQEKPAGHMKATTMSRTFTKQEKNAITSLLIKQEMILKGDLSNMEYDDSMGALFVDCSSDEEEDWDAPEIMKHVSEKPVIDWNLTEVIEFLNFIDKGRFQKFIPEFKRTLVNGEVLLSLQRTELKHEYSMNRGEITTIFQSICQLDNNYKRRLVRKYKKKKKKNYQGTHDRMVMSTVDWEGFLSKQNIIYPWEKKVEVGVGELVRLKDGREGRILFKGNTEFGEGIWLGVELTKGDGRNDGMVKGVRYFQARGSKHGIFIREQKVKEKLDLVLYQPPRLNRSAESLDLASPRRTSYATLTVYGDDLGDAEHDTRKLLDDIDRAEKLAAREQEWYLSSSTE